MNQDSSETNRISLLSTTAAAQSAAARSKNFWAAPLAATNGLNNGPLKLTLSAYLRPENAVRLTDADPAALIHDRYELLDPSLCRTLGHGASSTVRLAYRRSDDRPVAVKTIAKHDALGLWSRANRWRRGARGVPASSPRDEAGRVRREARKAPRLDEADVLTSLRGACPSIVQLLDVYETHSEVQLVLEYCEGGDLFDCIKRRKQAEEEPENSEEPLIHGSFSELETATVAKTLLGVLDALHSRNIVHRDIKPENIMLVHEDAGGDAQLGPVKLTDFGLARILHGADDASASSQDSVGPEEHLPMKQRSRAYSRVGSDYYAAPEVHLGAGYDTPVDIYSLGVTLYVMLCGTPPSSTSFFKSEDADLSDEASISDESTRSTQSSQDSMSSLFPTELKVSPLAQDLVSKMIHPDPDKRITATEALKHEWIAKNCVSDDIQAMAHVASKLSMSSSSDSLTRSRALSFAETESFLRIGPALPVFPPSNSPAPKLMGVMAIGQTPKTSRPTSPNFGASSAISLALADVCSKLAPLVNEQHLKKKKRQRYAHPQVDKIRFRKRSRGCCRDEHTRKRKRTSCSKRVCLDMTRNGRSSPSSCASCRIDRRFNSGVSPMGPFLPAKSHA